MKGILTSATFAVWTLVWCSNSIQENTDDWITIPPEIKDMYAEKIIEYQWCFATQIWNVLMIGCTTENFLKLQSQRLLSVDSECWLIWDNVFCAFDENIENI